MKNEIRVGRVSSINYSAGTAQIVYADKDNAVTADFPIYNNGGEYKMPKIDDLVLVLHLSNGSSSGVVLGTFWNKSALPPEGKKGIYRRDFSEIVGEAYLKYVNGTLTLKADNIVFDGKIPSVEEVDPTVPAWAKKPTKPQYTWGEIQGKPGTMPPSTHAHKKSDITDFPTSMPANGGNADTVNGLTVLTAVPTGAKFTDTVYTHPNDANTRHVTDAEKVAWNAKAPGGHTHVKANITDFPTSMPANGGNADTVNGLTVLTAVPEGAKFTDTIYTHPNDANTRHVSDTEKATWNAKAPGGHTHVKANITDFPTSMPANGGNADTVNGLTVLTAVPTGAKFTDTIYTHPNDANTRHVTDAEKAAWNAKAPGGHTHVKANITDFPAAMPPTAHTHGKEDISDFPATMPPSAHTHVKANITDFPTSMPANGGNAATVNGLTVLTAVPEGAKFTDTIYTHPNDANTRHVSDAEKTAWNAKAPGGHTHVKANITDFPATMPPSAHTHVKANITDFPTSMPANGGNAATVNGLTVLTAVPAGAKFTDTIYTHPNDANTRHVTDAEKAAWNGIEVGGRNLWIENLLVAGYIAGSPGTITPSPTMPQHQTMAELTAVKGGSNIVWQLWNPNKTVNTTNANRVAFFDSSKAYLSLVTLPSLTSAEYQSGVLTAPSNAAYARLAIICGSTTGGRDPDIKVKFERGNRATDLTPAPEDVQAAIDATKIHTHKKADITDFPTSMPANGGNADTVNGLTVLTAVPTGAKFTDTIYTHPNDANTRHVSDTEKAAWNAKAPGGHTHVKANITDFPAAMPPTDHTHGKEDISDFPATMPPSAHTHVKSNITDFPTSMPANGGNAATVNGLTVLTAVPAGAKFTDTVYTHPNDANTRHVSDTEKAAWNAKAPSGHTHVKANITDFPATMPPSAHTHVKANITDFPTSMPANGGNAATVNGLTVLTAVPAGAKFTDTVYTHPNDANTRHVTDTEKTTWNAKAPGGHTHVKANITDFPATMPPTAHTHSAADITTGTLEIAQEFSGTPTNTYIPFPKDGRMRSIAAMETGYLKITLPQTWTGSLLIFTVDIFNMFDGTTCSYTISGYNLKSREWGYVTAYSVSGKTIRLGNLPVRYGHDGTKCAVYIGDANTIWSYPQITLKDITVGYANYELESWNQGWSLEITPTLGTITKTVTSPNITTGIDADTVNGFTVLTAVPTGAKFTDTIYTHPNDANTRHVSDTEKTAWNAKAPGGHTHVKANITDFPTSMPASDVPAWAKAAGKPTYTKAEVGLGSVDNTADANKTVYSANRLAGKLPGGSGATKNVVPVIGPDGVMEINKYVDFHDTNSTLDFDVRLFQNENTLGIQTKGGGVFDIKTIVSGNQSFTANANQITSMRCAINPPFRVLDSVIAVINSNHPEYFSRPITVGGVGTSGFNVLAYMDRTIDVPVRWIAIGEY